MVAFMENEQAGQAVQNHEAASTQEAGNERERTMSSLLAKMTHPEEVLPEDPQLEPAESGADAGAEETEGVVADGEVATEEGVDHEPKAKNFRGRWDHLNEEERRVVELTTKRGLSLSEAYRAVYGVEGSAEKEGVRKGDQEDGKPTGADEALYQVEGEIAASEERLQRLKEERLGARGDMEAYDKAVEAYLGERELLQELRLKQRSMQSEAVERAERARVEARQQVQEALAAEFPEALVPGTELHEACQEEMAYLREIGSPLKDDPAAAYKVARRLARLFGRRGEGAAAPATTMGPPPKRTMRPLPVGGVPVETPLVALERRVSGANSSGAMLDLMREYGTPIEALMRG